MTEGLPLWGGLVALAGVVTWLLGPRVVAWCWARGLVASITSRSSHVVPTPHGGGVVLPLVVTPIGLWLVHWQGLPFADFLTVLLIAGVPVAYVGWCDDAHELSARFRLLVHMLAVAVALMVLPPLFDFLPLWLEKMVLMLAWAWFINLTNFMDGADGQVGSHSALIAVGIAGLVPPLAPVALLLSAAAGGLLRVNGPWAQPGRKVFLGDVGSTWLGFMLGGLLLVGCADDTWRVVWPLATLALFLCADATSTLVRRLLQGHNPLMPHTDFWFHRYLALGHTHGQLLTASVGLGLMLLGLAWGGYALSTPQSYGWVVAAFIFGLLACLVAAWYVLWQQTLSKT